MTGVVAQGRGISPGGAQPRDREGTSPCQAIVGDGWRRSLHFTALPKRGFC